MFILVDENFNVINPEGSGLAQGGNDAQVSNHPGSQRLDLRPQARLHPGSRRLSEREVQKSGVTNSFDTVEEDNAFLHAGIGVARGIFRSNQSVSRSSRERIKVQNA